MIDACFLFDQFNRAFAQGQTYSFTGAWTYQLFENP